MNVIHADQENAEFHAQQLADETGKPVDVFQLPGGKFITVTCDMDAPFAADAVSARWPGRRGNHAQLRG